jgi:YidC/Oxa1 family membrane protein insertase
VNRLLVIPVFNWLDTFGWNYGWIILALTLIIKVLLFPLTYKSLVSGAKMKVLKPEIDELKTKFEKDPTRMQSEQMKLFQKAGVNPLGGCLPSLISFPLPLNSGNKVSCGPMIYQPTIPFWIYRLPSPSTEPM